MHIKPRLLALALTIGLLGCDPNVDDIDLATTAEASSRVTACNFGNGGRWRVGETCKAYPNDDIWQVYQCVQNGEMNHIGICEGRECAPINPCY